MGKGIPVLFLVLFSMEHLQRVWLASRERLPFRTPGSVPILGLANAPIVETKFLELAMSLLDFSPRIPLGTFSILLSKFVLNIDHFRNFLSCFISNLWCFRRFFTCHWQITYHKAIMCKSNILIIIRMLSISRNSVLNIGLLVFPPKLQFQFES